MSQRIGISVYCAVCGQRKGPHGRSHPAVLRLCNEDCPGYKLNPQVGCLWPGETYKDFGYKCCDAATRELTEAEERQKEAEERDER